LNAYCRRTMGATQHQMPMPTNGKAGTLSDARQAQMVMNYAACTVTTSLQELCPALCHSRRRRVLQQGGSWKCRPVYPTAPPPILVSVCVGASARTRKCACARTHCMHTRTLTRMHTHACTHAHARAHTHTQTHARARTCSRIVYIVYVRTLTHAAGHTPYQRAKRIYGPHAARHTRAADAHHLVHAACIRRSA
jgi:hypothetical protein